MAVVQKELHARLFQTLKSKIISPVSMGILCISVYMSFTGSECGCKNEKPQNEFCILSHSFLLKINGFPLVLWELNPEQGRGTSSVLLWPQAAQC